MLNIAKTCHLRATYTYVNCSILGSSLVGGCQYFEGTISMEQSLSQKAVADQLLHVHKSLPSVPNLIQVI
jgi:hypothetical protein